MTKRGRGGHSVVAPRSASSTCFAAQFRQLFYLLHPLRKKQTPHIHKSAPELILALFKNW